MRNLSISRRIRLAVFFPFFLIACFAFSGAFVQYRRQQSITEEVNNEFEVLRGPKVFTYLANGDLSLTAQETVSIVSFTHEMGLSGPNVSTMQVFKKGMAFVFSETGRYDLLVLEVNTHRVMRRIRIVVNIPPQRADIHSA